MSLQHTEEDYVSLLLRVNWVFRILMLEHKDRGEIPNVPNRDLRPQKALTKSSWNLLHKYLRMRRPSLLELSHFITSFMLDMWLSSPAIS